MEVQPIRDRNKIQKIKQLLKEKSPRDYLLFIMGINSGLRISDILKLKVKDVKNKTHINIEETKTRKKKRFLINVNLKHAIDQYITNKKDDEYLFKSRQGGNTPINRTMVYKILNNVASLVGLTDVGTHTLRKTFSYWHYKQFKDTALLQEILNHSSQRITLIYAGIAQDEIDESYMLFDI